MCGITGSVCWETPDTTELIGLMNESMRHRGPDASGVIRKGPAVLAHRRLAIIDLSEEANQPMCDSTQQFWIVFNGEIYNYQVLRRELKSRGARFRTGSDTEVILQGYIHLGVDCVKRLNGMFAFAVWDQPNRRLFLARDRVGKKPLYFKRIGRDGIVFASELKALRWHPAVSDQINPRAISQFLSLNYVLTDECFLAGVEKLPAGHYLVVEQGKRYDPRSFWDLAGSFRQKARFRSEEEAGEALNGLLQDSVDLRLVSDVPLGAFLSGGIDSSAVTAAMNRLRPPAENKTFSIGFNEETYNELPQARYVADYLGVDHREKLVNVDMAGILPEMVYFADEPFADTSFIPMYYLAKFARQQVKVCLSGDGGDEILGGYETYVADKLHSYIRRMPRFLVRGFERAVDTLLPVNFAKVSLDYRLRHFLAGYDFEAPRAHYSWRVIFDDEEKKSLVRPEHYKDVIEYDPYVSFKKHFDAVSDCHLLDQAMYVDIKTWLADDILHKVDRATMAHSLEARAPFLDHRLVEFAASLPVSLKVKRLNKKYLLKKNQRRYLPAKVTNAPKRGFNAPVSHWLNGELKELARTATLCPQMLEWFDPNVIEALWRDHETKRRDNGLRLFGLTCLGLWLSDTLTGDRRTR